MDTMVGVAPKAAAKLVKLPRKSRLLGYLEDHEAYFAAEKRKIWDQVGDLSEFRITYGRILVAEWWTEDAQRLADRKSVIIRPDQTNTNAKYNGLTGLVLKLGPHAYEDNEHIAWHLDEVVKVGDWVAFRRGDGLTIEIWGQTCVLLENEHAIRAIIDRPDIV